MSFKFDWFLKGMVAAVVLAFAWPDPGARGGFLHAELLNKLGVALVFCLNGLSLSLLALKAGALRWPVHLLIQLCTFGLFPLLGIGLIHLLQGWLSPDLQTGLFYLCALPSTVSSSVALTVASRGNVPVALFNATLSTLIGVLLTPMWMAWLLDRTGLHFDVVPVILDLLVWVVLPLVAGQMARPWLGAWAARHKARLQVVDRLTILLLVYTSFCDSVRSGVWSRQETTAVVLTVVISMLLFGVVLGLIRTVAHSLNWSVEDRIAAVFCGSKKTLASGVPMAQMIFGGSPALGLILMPIMIYHPLQLALGSVLAQRWASRKAMPPQR